MKKKSTILIWLQFLMFSNLKNSQGVPVFANQAQSVLFPVYQARLSQALITLSSLQITL